MSAYSSLPPNLPGYSNSTLGGCNYQIDHHLDCSDFEIVDFLLTDDVYEKDPTSIFIESGTPSPIFPELSDETGGDNNNNHHAASSMQRKSKGDGKKTKTNGGYRVAFRTKSEIENMDDGYKWRKYGKKSVKNSPNPRNYYRCSSEGCHVKKRVERDREDSIYVMTTYDGVHNHESPSILYYNEMPLMVPTGWTLQASQSSC